MSYVTIPDPLFSTLKSMFEPVEVRDSAGNVVGHFIPAGGPAGDDRQPKISEQEMDRRERAGGGRPLTAILASTQPCKVGNFGS